jgi:rhodanese-related sulfurtransferase
MLREGNVRQARAREEEAMAEFTRIGVDDAYRQVSTGQALLVCAYEDEAKCRQMQLQGSIPLTQFASRVPSLPKDQEIIFYCAWPAEATSAGQAVRYQAQGFTNVKAMKGSTMAWQQAGYPMAQ